MYPYQSFNLLPLALSSLYKIATYAKISYLNSSNNNIEIRGGRAAPRPDNTWDHTSERAKNLLKLESSKKVEASNAIEEVLVTNAFG
ncbi:hypothetical protein Scep_026406 [Stephania cephalantha]|uniref:Uncharacterized protein n=1 Tax=Stephania cephalantha TaxID=152367 RepID=A0AAP0EQD7_9MAGN